VTGSIADGLLLPDTQIRVPPGDLIYMQIKFTGRDTGRQCGEIVLYTNWLVDETDNPPGTFALLNLKGTVVSSM
jgi:hypothetical protein